ncbi:MAG: hypothetical protein V7776_12200 [Halopseudomonas aestusnigri]
MATLNSHNGSNATAKTDQKLRKREKLICGAFLNVFVILAVLAGGFPIGNAVLPLFVSFTVGYFFLSLFVSREKRDIKRILLGGCLATFLSFFLCFKVFDVVMAVKFWDIHFLFYGLVPLHFAPIFASVFTPFVCLAFIRLDRHFWEHRQNQNPGDILIDTDHNIQV